MRIHNPFSKDFLAAIGAIALPMAVQQLVMSSVNIIDMVMVGALGDVAIAAAGISNQVFFIYSLFLFGAYSGASVFLSQFWGKGDVPNIRRTMGYMLAVGMFLALGFLLASELCPGFLLRWYSSDPAVVQAGIPYLKWVAWSYPLNALAFCYSFTCRCTGRVRLPMIASFTAIITNVAFNYLLIYGKFGFPRLELAGAAIATLLSRVTETGTVVIAVYIMRLPAAGTPKQFFRFDKEFGLRLFKICAPVVANEGLWAIGTTLYTAIYGMLGTAALAAVQVVSSIVNLFTVFARSFANAASVLIGNRIGAGSNDGARDYANRSIWLLACSGLVMGLLLLALQGPALGFFALSDEGRDLAMRLLFVNALVMIPSYMNMLLVVGICRSGGDTLWSGIVDVATLWLLGLPFGFMGAKLGLSVEFVFLLISTENLGKMILCLWRVRSGKWLHNVVEGVKD
ncbi:MAG: MATE family efflux transporter [Christensenellaceae bacterium]|jgi:putative MATE family efflux protein|nr:MATE family efflux transporter [Christensenellaceae bacterium]